MKLAPTRRRILCVEDNPDICELIAAVLTEYDVDSATGVEEAWALFNRERFSIVVLDYILPDGNGLKLCELIRAADVLTPIIFITGDPDLTEAEVRVAGAQRLVRKKDLTFIDELLTSVQALAEDIA